MRIYIAGPWADRAQMPAYAKAVENLGHVITHRWWEAEDTKEGFDASDAVLAKQAQWDVDGVKAAQLVMVINSAKSEGKALEQGVALADKKGIIAVGKRGEFSKNVFHYLPNYKWVDDFDGALNVLKTINWIMEIS